MKQIILIFFLSIYVFANNEPLKKQLHNMLLQTLPETTCKEKLIFIECYFVTIQECKILIEKSVTPCFEQFENKVNGNISREQFINIAGDIGKCVGSKYYKILQKENKVDLTCYHSPKWLK
ncbi:MAG: hypothetical protein PHG81_11335 [Aliarcobacter sp.]|nr:hypothetical protein [Aliarcobacter sp.]